MLLANIYISQLSTYSLSLIDKKHTTKKDFILWLGHERFLDLERVCPTCGRQLRVVKDARRAIDGYSLRCTSCKYSASIRRDSFFDRYHIELKER